MAVSEGTGLQCLPALCSHLQDNSLYGMPTFKQINLILYFYEIRHARMAVGVIFPPLLSSGRSLTLTLP